MEFAAYPQRLTAVLHAAHMCLFELDLTQHCYTYLENTQEIFGQEASALLAQLSCHQIALDQLVHADDLEVAMAAGHEVLSGHQTAFQVRLRHHDGSYQWCKISVTPVIEEGVSTRAIGVISNIQSFRDRAQKLAEEARIDNFTGLYHKLHFEKVAEAILLNHPQQRHALILLDLDNFEEFNKIYGKLRGDGVLRAVSGGLRKLFPKPNIVGRFGGDEFIILMQNLENDQVLENKLQQMMATGDVALKVTKSIGVAVYPDDGVKFSDLLHHTELALRQSKQQKNTTSHYTAE